jgi:hypothetical protein
LPNVFANTVFYKAHPNSQFTATRRNCDSQTRRATIKQNIRITVLAIIILISTMGMILITPAKVPDVSSNYNHYFGDLHTHTGFSDAWEGTPADA